jgi:undecaprenyl-diphosphatase
MNIVEWSVNVVEWLDGSAASVVAPLHRPWLNSGLIAATHLGDGAVAAGVAALFVVLLLLLRRWRPALCIAAAVAAGFLLAEGVKDVVGRPRPDVAWRPAEYPLPKTPSFPSGHAVDSTVAYASLGLIAGRRLRRRWLRVLALVLGLALPLLVGFTRVYLGVHYFTDVLAGWGVGLTLALLAAWADRRWGGSEAARETHLPRHETAG